MIPNSTNQRLTELSYFHLSLLAYLKKAHPDKAGDRSLIAGRVDLAAESYSQAVKSGLSHVQATEIANETLFKGLHFSPYTIVLEILWNEFFEEVNPEEARVKGTVLLPECRAIFDKYKLNDDYAGTPEYQSLYTELTGTILILLESELQ